MKGNVVRIILEDANEKFGAFVGGQNLLDEKDGSGLGKDVNEHRGINKLHK